MKSDWLGVAVAVAVVAIVAAGYRLMTRKRRDVSMVAKTPSESMVTGIEMLTPSQCTLTNICYGGELLAIIDKVGGACAIKHARGSVVTVAMSEIHFETPAKISDILILSGKVTAAFTSSMEVEVLVYVEHPLTGERRFCCRALLKFVCLGANRRSKRVPPLLPETPDEIKAHNGALRRDKLFRQREVVPLASVPDLWDAYLKLSSGEVLGRPLSPKATRIEMTKVVMPQHANPLGICFGGQVLQWMEQAASVAALRTCRSAVLTVGLDRMTFISKVPIGACVLIRAQVNRIFKTSLEVGIRVEVIELVTEMDAGLHSNTGYFTFVAVDDQNKAMAINSCIVPENNEDKLRFLQAEERRRQRFVVRERSRSSPRPLHT